MSQDRSAAARAALESRARRLAPLPGARRRPGVPSAAPRRGGAGRRRAEARRRAGSSCRSFCSRPSAMAAKFGYDYFVEGRFLVSTDDAYVGANTAIIAAKAPGISPRSPVAHNQIVHQGDLLAMIDDGDYRSRSTPPRTRSTRRTRRSRASAARSRRRASVIAQAAGADRRLAGATGAPPRPIQRAALEYDRSHKLAQTNFGSQQRLEQATADRDRTAAAIAGGQGERRLGAAALEGAKANLDVLKAQQRRGRARRAPNSSTALAKAERDLSFTEILAPFDGVVGNKAVEVGQYRRSRATRLMALVPLDSVYVDANFKETQLDGDPAGPEGRRRRRRARRQVDPGVVTSISPASGAQFSLLPPDNATGNFTKVVQRVAVRITLAPDGDRRTARCGRAFPSSPPCTRATRASRSRRCSARSASARGRQGAAAVSDASRRRRAAPAAPAPAGRAAGGAAGEHFDKRRLVAFIFMVFGMFMAILDIQIVSASLSQIQAGLSASQDEVTWVQTELSRSPKSS